ncbi:DNA-binding winged helix-turn-helix (wHTH) protein [Bradyrhizobium macuxiense]|uniref:DNA-binding winged helix-turn-helix (WHTH) protein n=1 Tax=Bradyrhizobium macuxiense TaxID=1755647 RepID=A0A560L9V6_9BRAD|nr:transcriptional regulator [Bradyrhizobium macuxiense]TWB92122.1 DNA-binding winged helix-turn-helix (wHTH) protein [Bradyrhizobium macuxiense]
MAFSFGLFELDEAGRVLLCARQEIPLQPRVFDLLVYLVRHRERVISKEELLEAVWPDVMVTDNSLQRAVSSLRAALRQGGMDGAVRNLPGKGYRFFVDSEIRQPERIAEKQADATLGLARRAAAAQLWLQAATLFESAKDDRQLSAGDLHDWALALQCLGKAAAAIPILVRAVAVRSEAGDAAGAAVDAIALSGLHFESGQAAIGKGWLARAEDWASKLDDPPTTALLLWMKSKLAAFDGEPEQALALADAAYMSVRYKDALNVEALSLAYRGFYRLCLGDTHGGLADQDHAAAVALSSNNLDPIMGGSLYCNILWAARMFGDWARADQWTRSYQNFCSSSGMELTGSCQLHRSEVLGIRGSLDEALARIQDALARLTSDAPWSMGDANRVLGDILAATGNDDAALDAYDKAYTLGWCPEPGRAMLLLARGEAEAAYAGLERSLIGKTWWTLQRRGILLAHLALVAAHTRRSGQAKALICELSGNPVRWPMPSIRALTNEAQAILALARQDHEAAMRHLHLARQLWSSIEGRVQVVRLRLQISRLQLERGDVCGATAEVHAARLLATELGSPKRVAECVALQQQIEASRPAMPRAERRQAVSR